ncbi:hypothetical protein SAMN04515691_0593 [Leifsonia sp. 98AMF]|uniref:hypothetical protein n=1 Tax=unclassified Leifsonia TaxID=2663824 RepID=UPI00087AB0AD|nr:MULTISPECIES: hypothetical protein [unclassified Leifsonia]SDH63997.1 hypothetical protein SAMN04515690_3426 [Leifsonia sp. 197AMF]SDI75431.1 hypothetical protein SAMN04515684_0362 [Leifsonia sp. 466MF]SDK12212.1 hypothetical protein SAMN04515683_2387 [Leifsonia sp. 157MF]SDN78630.1 hypothetical protein SAMN04515686_2564 [Leifsonia sp. 509MF]SEN28941.1 hypothetical protein SAMN04515685_2372 [Leifsonia sp. 467MF]
MHQTDWNSADLAGANLGDLIEGLASGIQDVVEGIQGGIDALVNDAAVRLLNAVLPLMVHGRYTAIRAAGWVGVEASTVELTGRAAGVTVSNAVLAGLVAKKVEEGVGRITSELDYAHGVNSIA